MATEISPCGVVDPVDPEILLDLLAPESGSQNKPVSLSLSLSLSRVRLTYSVGFARGGFACGLADDNRRDRREQRQRRRATYAHGGGVDTGDNGDISKKKKKTYPRDHGTSCASNV